MDQYKAEKAARDEGRAEQEHPSKDEITPELIEKLRVRLNDTNIPMATRFRALFTLKNVGGQQAVDALASALGDDSVLLKHEICYCLGQMGDPHAVPILIKTLTNTSENAVVRHEAGEALGAICVPEVIPVLEAHVNDPAIEVSETCQIALDRVNWFVQNKVDKHHTPYDTRDPAPAYTDKTADELKEIYLDPSKSLFERYRAMFALRDSTDPRAVEILAMGFSDQSALFRHEIAFVFGQLQSQKAEAPLIKVLENATEHGMVRHEAAEALASIAGPQTLPLLQKYSTDSQQIVKDSCIVALDIYEYYNDPNSFQYADALQHVQK